MVIFDEASFIKSHRTKRFKYAYKLTKNIKYILLTTATPWATGLENCWTYVSIIDRGERFGTSYNKFLETYFRPARTINHVVTKWTLLPGSKRNYP